MIENGYLKKNTLKQQIRKAFANTLYPGDDNLVRDDCSDCFEYRQAFQGKHWRDITLEMLLYSYTTMVFFTKEAYHFYLPAYMIISIDHNDEADVIPDFMIFGFDNQEYSYDTDKDLLEAIPVLDDWKAKRNRGFTKPQQAALLAFLDVMLDEYADEDWPDNPHSKSVNKAIKSLTNLWTEEDSL